MDDMYKNFTQITSCRLCKSKTLDVFVDFLDVPIGNNLQDTKELSKKVEFF